MAILTLEPLENITSILILVLAAEVRERIPHNYRYRRLSLTEAAGEDSSMSHTLTAARVPAPGRILSRELEARGWTQKDLAEIMGRPIQTINEIIRGSKQITPETAIELSQALGTSFEFWTNLEAKYRHKTITRKEKPMKKPPIG
ncbi:HigA family addiction module antitoxin [aff. Roholtiella sp. LEGE 12411]|uniref:HigA family addiction module antitoxin n=1 Tax=aff. Roholtiella sp. LEGE 12411 TaxID=1828822 RepID=UPI001FC8E4CE|nr:HigA family addiction module antitoxin [aff. Roholtiella sp. LEGE 12411]